MFCIYKINIVGSNFHAQNVSSRIFSLPMSQICFHMFSEDSNLRPLRFNFDSTPLLQASTLVFYQNLIFDWLENSLCTILEKERTNLMQETINNLNADLLFQECQLHALFTTLFSLVGKQNPGQVLSSLLNKPTAVIFIGDVLIKIFCTNTNVTLLYSLQFGKFFSSRPVVHIPGPNSTFKIGQVLRDSNVYAGVRLLEKFVPGRISAFLIHNKFYTYQNYTLTHANTSINLYQPP